MTVHDAGRALPAADVPVMTVQDAERALLAVFDPAIPPQLNPHAAQAISHLDRWTAEHAVVGDAARDRFAQADFGRFAAVTYPTADAAGLALAAEWFAWLFLLDDHLDDGLLGKDPGRVNDLMAMLLRVVTAGPGEQPAALGGPPIVTAMAELWARTIPEATPSWRQRLIEHAAACVLAAQTEARNRSQGVIPGEADYIEMRRHTGAIYVCMDLIEIVEHAYLPAEVCASDLFSRTLQAACDVVCWVNDIFSLDKETALGEVHNLVTVVQHARGLTVEQAMTAVTGMVITRLEDFLDDEPQVRAQWPQDQRAVDAGLAGMRSWMRGNLDWSIRTHRYREPGHGAGGPAGYVEESVVASGALG